MSPVVSFVVTCYNFEAYIGECLDSILAQTASDDYEIIVVDDASSDDSAAVIQAFTDPRIRFVRHAKNCGSVLTRQEGLFLARGKYVTHTCGDDRLRPYFLERVLPIMEAHPDVGMVYGDVAHINGQGEIVAEVWEGIRSRAAHQGNDFQGDEYLALLLENVIPISSVLVRREAVEQVLPLRQDLSFLDWYMHLRIARNYKLYYLAQTLAEYRIHGKNQHMWHERARAYRETVLHVLDEMFNSPERAAETSKIRARTYAKAYRRFGDSAFGRDEMDDARQHYLDALHWTPRLALDSRFVRHLLGTWVGQARYNTFKARFQRLNSKPSNSA